MHLWVHCLPLAAHCIILSLTCACIDVCILATQTFNCSLDGSDYEIQFYSTFFSFSFWCPILFTFKYKNKLKDTDRELVEWNKRKKFHKSTGENAFYIHWISRAERNGVFSANDKMFVNLLENWIPLEVTPNSIVPNTGRPFLFPLFISPSLSLHFFFLFFFFIFIIKNLHKINILRVFCG